LEGNERRQRFSLRVEKRSVPTTTSRLVELVDVHLGSTRSASDLHGLRVPLGAESLGNGIGARLVVTKLGEEKREAVTLGGYKGLGTGETPEESLVPGGPGNTTNHPALAGSDAEVLLPGARMGAILVGMDSKTVGNERTVTTDNALHELLTLTSTVDLTNEDLSGLRNATELLEGLELVPSGDVEAAIKTSLSRESRANAGGGVASLRVRAKVSGVVGLIPDGEATSAVSNENRNNTANKLGDVLRGRVNTRRLGASLSVEEWSSPPGSNTGDGELNPELASPGSLDEVDVAVKLFQGLGTTARVEQVKVKIRADTGSTELLDLVESQLTLSTIDLKEHGLILSAELNAFVVSGETTREAAPPGLLHVDPVGNSARPAGVLGGRAPPEGIDHAVDSIGERSDTSLRGTNTTATGPLLTT